MNEPYPRPQRRPASQWTRPLLHGDNGGYWYDSGRKRRSGLGEDHDGAGGLDGLILPSLSPCDITIAGDPGVCPSCGGKINPLTMGCRC